MIFKLSYWSTQWHSASALCSPSTIFDYLQTYLTRVPVPTAGNPAQAGNLRPKDIFPVFVISTFYQATHVLPVSTMYLACFNTYYLQMAVQASWRQNTKTKFYPLDRVWKLWTSENFDKVQQ